MDIDKEVLKKLDDTIGTDPTLLDVVDILDIEPDNPDKKTKNKKPLFKQKKANKIKNKDLNDKNKTNSSASNPKRKTFKKVIFALIIILLILGVAFGIFIYLRLAKNHKDNENKIELYNLSLYIDDELSTDIADYGDFSRIDLAKCTLDTSKVNTSVVGTYEYSVVCDNVKTTAKIVVSETPVFNLETLVLYKKLDEEVNINEFIKASGNYKYAYVEENIIENTNELGMFSIAINVTNDLGQEKVFYAVLYRISEKASMYLTCDSPMQVEEEYSYYLTDKIPFNDERNSLNSALRVYNYKYDSVRDFDALLAGVQNGKISINNIRGYVIMNYQNLTLKIVNELSESTLITEYNGTLPTAFTNLNNYYRNTKNYSCKI